MKTYHLLGGQRGLFHRPAIAVDMVDGLRLDLRQIGAQDQRLLVKWIMKDVDVKGWRIWGDLGGREQQIMPGLHVDSTTFMDKVTLLMGDRGGNGLVFVFAWQWTHKFAVFGMTALAFVAWQLIAPCRAVGGKADNIAVYRSTL